MKAVFNGRYEEGHCRSKRLRCCCGIVVVLDVPRRKISWEVDESDLAPLPHGNTV